MAEIDKPKHRFQNKQDFRSYYWYDKCYFNAYLLNICKRLINSILYWKSCRKHYQKGNIDYSCIRSNKQMIEKVTEDKKG